MNAILTLLQLIAELLRALLQRQKTEEAQANSDAIDSDPASVFLSKFNKGNKDGSSIPKPAKRDGE